MKTFRKVLDFIIKTISRKIWFSWCLNSTQKIHKLYFFFSPAGGYHVGWPPVHTQNFPKKLHFLPPDTQTYVCVSGGKKCYFFGKKTLAQVFYCEFWKKFKNTSPFYQNTSGPLLLVILKYCNTWKNLISFSFQQNTSYINLSGVIIFKWW